ncbi:MAG: multicopper oxidase family protein, partial [Bryobacteraceae bacterium]
MSRSRRDFLKLAAAGALPLLDSACFYRRPEMRLLSSRAKLPPQFEAPLPRIPVLKPVRADSNTDYYEFETRPATARILPGLNTEIWAHNGIFPGPTIEARGGRRVSVTVRNRLPVPIVNHLHGGHTPPESDGYPTDLILPNGSFQPVMHDAMARIATGEREYIYPNDQRAATLWYHDHRMDFTGPQVWRGLAGLYILRDDEESKLPLPRAEKEIALLICDRSFDADGALIYPALDPSLKLRSGVPARYSGGVMGDVILVNGAPWPRLEVSNTKYRFRVLNASNARRYELALDPPPVGSSFIQIGSDGGLLESPVTHQTVRIAPSERFDLVIDFSKYPVGSLVTLANRAGSR